jgi:hypothetical protein
MQIQLKLLTEQHCAFSPRDGEPGVRLITYDPQAVYKVTAALLFAHSDKSLQQLLDLCKQLPDEEVARILDGACSSREHRRQKSPRALEHAEFTFEILSDFGAYRDMHRHRMLTQERQLLTCNYGFYTPSEILGTEVESEYYEALCRAKEVFDAIACELPEEAQYVVPMAFHIRWYFHVNLRSLQWLCELRSSPAGHPSYRFIAQRLAKEVCEVFPAFERFFKFVDFNGYELGRLGQEQRRADKRPEG